MEIVGKIIFKLPLQSGVSKAGNNWSKQEYVLETMDAYPKKVHFDMFGERADQYPLNVGQIVKLSFDIESREYNGRWYTSIRGWKAEDASNEVPAAAAAPAPAAGIAAAPAPAAPQYQAPAAPAAPAAMDPGAPAADFGGGAVDDLPF